MKEENSRFLPGDGVPGKSIIGVYGPGLSVARGDQPGEWSFRNPRYADVRSWKEEVLPKVEEQIATPVPLQNFRPVVRVVDKYVYDGLEIEELEWNQPFGYPTRAVLLKPEGVRKPLPGILALHDHGGNKYFGLRKITRTGDAQHPLMTEHQKEYYEGRAWANEAARQGYAVLVHDVFTFASRRVRFADMEEIPWGEAATSGKSDANPEDPENISVYNRWAAGHEHIMAKSLFSAGTTWPGMFLGEDRLALDILSSRPDVDSSRIGTAGLSGGGLRSVYLAGLDLRIQCVVTVGFMTTWDDFLLHKSFTHTWMTYTPGLAPKMDFSEILTLRLPLPAMILNDTEDNLFTLSEMRKAGAILKENYEKAGCPEHLSVRFYPGPHKFDIPMQEDAFRWLDRWLKDEDR